MRKQALVHTYRKNCPIRKPSIANEEINISGDRLPNALRDITNLSNNITKDARTERHLKLLQKRKKTELGSPEVTQSQIVNVQSVGATLPVPTQLLVLFVFIYVLCI